LSICHLLVYCSFTNINSSEMAELRLNFDDPYIHSGSLL